MSSFICLDEGDDTDPLVCPFKGTRVVHDPVKGRCLENLLPRQPGELLFVEDALVFSSYVESDDNAPDGVDAHVNGRMLLRALGTAALNELHDAHEELSALPRIDCLDTARNFLQLIALTHLGDILRGEEGGRWVRQLSLLSRLTPGVHLSELQDTIRTFRHAFPRVLPVGMSDYQAALCLGILNTNQVELEDYGGSGLFVGTAIMEHSCAFNCSYTTHGSTLYMTATRAIEPGERLSIDYDNNFYSPTLVRKLSLFESYGFMCACMLCDGAAGVAAAGAGALGEEMQARAGTVWDSAVDRKRAFWCSACKQQGKQGIVCPAGPTSRGLRSVLQSASLPSKNASPAAGKQGKSKKGKSKGKSKSKKSPVKAMAVSSGDDEEPEEPEAEADGDMEGSRLDVSGMDLEALANALEAVPLEWSVCSTCGTLPAPGYTRKCLAREEYYRQNPPETHAEVASAGTEPDGLLHESHYLLFQALNCISQDLTNDARRCTDFRGVAPAAAAGNGSKKGKSQQGGKAGAVSAEERQRQLFEPALSAMQHCVRLLDQVLPVVHQEKVVFYDRLGQLAVCAGQIDLARSAFSAAYQMSVLASGVDVPQTQQLLLLSERPPQSREELTQRYNMRGGSGAVAAEAHGMETGDD